MSEPSTDTRDYVSSLAIVPWPDSGGTEFTQIVIDSRRFETPPAWATLTEGLSTAHTINLSTRSSFVVEPQFSDSSSVYGATSGDKETTLEVLRVLDADDADSAMLTLVDELRAGDWLLEMELSMIASGLLTRDSDLRALALETLAAAKVRASELSVVALILELLDSDSEQLRFAAIAAASDLSDLRQFVVASPISRLVSRDDSPDVRAAASAYCSHVGSRRRACY